MITADARDLQQVEDGGAEPAHLPVECLDQRRLARREPIQPALQQVSGTHDPGQRRTQFVRHIGREPAFPFEPVLHRIGHVVERRRDGHEVRVLAHRHAGLKIARGDVARPIGKVAQGPQKSVAGGTSDDPADQERHDRGADEDPTQNREGGVQRREGEGLNEDAAGSDRHADREVRVTVGCREALEGTRTGGFAEERGGQFPGRHRHVGRVPGVVHPEKGLTVLGRGHALERFSGTDPLGQGGVHHPRVDEGLVEGGILTLLNQIEPGAEVGGPRDDQGDHQADERERQSDSVRQTGSSAEPVPRPLHGRCHFTIRPGSRLEPVTESADGHQVDRLGRVDLKFGAQAVDQVVDHTTVAGVAVSPHATE